MVSIRQNQVVLRSKKWNQIIIPNSETIHPFKGLPIYQFLKDVQTQNYQNQLSFNWGSLQDQFVFTPRVMYQKVILSLATWRFQQVDIQALIQKTIGISDDQQLINVIKNCR